MITTLQICLENRQRIKFTVLLFFDDDLIAFIEGVGLVSGEMKLVLIVVDEHSRPFHDFPPVLKLLVVGERQFSQTHE